VQAENIATRTVASTLGVLLGLSSIDHGLLEIMHGNQPTTGYWINAQGPGHSWSLWTQGGEPAFTLVHNFLLTGILAALVGLLLVFWSFRFIHRPHGPAVFLLLSVVSYLVGGGLAQVFLFTLNWLVTTGIHSKLAFWRRMIPAKIRRPLGFLWRWALAAGAIQFLAALEIAAIGYFPGLPRDQQIVYRVLLEIGAGILVAFVVSIVSAFAFDVEAQSR
jgi:hypothetical protein